MLSFLLRHQHISIVPEIVKFQTESDRFKQKRGTKVPRCGISYVRKGLFANSVQCDGEVSGNFVKVEVEETFLDLYNIQTSRNIT